MREAMLYEKLPGGSVRCQLCQFRCRLIPGKRGVCRARVNRDGTLETLVYGLVSSAGADPIEKKPLFHFYPGTRVFSLGGWGCNFRCLHCQNDSIAYANADGREARSGDVMSADDSVRLAGRHGCQGISWTYNEPTIWFEFTYDSARAAKAKGLYTVYVTNGFMTPEALDTIGPYLDAWRVDVKGASKDFYRRLARVSDPAGILEVAVRAKQRWGMHVEVVTNVIPGWNDDDEQLESIARWMLKELGELTPWHVTAFHPSAQMMNVPATPVSTLERAAAIGAREGLKFVYLGNVPGHPAENTHCYSCGHTNIQRRGYSVRLAEVTTEGRCSHCGADLNIRGVVA